MAGFKQLSPVAAGYLCALTPSGSELLAGRFMQVVDSSDAVGTVGIVGVLPAGCLPYAVSVKADVLGAGFKASFGLANAAGTDISTAAADGGAAWITDDTTGAAGGYVQVASPALGKVVPVDHDRFIVMKVTGAAVNAGQAGLTLLYHAA